MLLRCFKSIIICFSILIPIPIFALTLPLPSTGSNVVGRIHTIAVPRGYNITDLGQKYSVGYLEFLEANPRVNINSLWTGEKLVLPTRYILPSATRRGIVINLAELRLYYFPPGKNIVYTFPIGIGRSHTPTPLIKTRIVSKRKNPTWIPTADTHKEAMEMGIMLPTRVLPGPQNPLGKYAIRLGLRTYLIHGTNRPEGVGIKSSGGCIRMYPRDIKQLFHLVKIGTPVNIVDQAVKVGWRKNILYLEVHVPVDLKRGKTDETLQPIMSLLKNEVLKWHAKIDWSRAILIAEHQTGIPAPVGRRYFKKKVDEVASEEKTISQHEIYPQRNEQTDNTTHN
jgi:L,D-transpeptidase ErfK/SrfK